MRDVLGFKILVHSGRLCLPNRGQKLGERGEKTVHIETAGAWLLVQWHARRGYWLRSGGKHGTPLTAPTYVCRRPERGAMKRRVPTAGGLPAIPALSAASTMLAKLPLLREFMSATAYEDGTMRTPGYFTLRNRMHSYEVTLYDYDSGMRLVARGPDLDKTFSLAETLLGTEEAQWEVDTYLMGQLEKKKPRKKGA